MRNNILITGASSGLGAEMARQFAAMGRNLALCARRGDRLEELRSALTAANPGITVALRALDVNDHDAVFTVFRELRDELGGVDRVIVNAGIAKGQPIGTGHFRVNRETAQTNFLAALAQCEAAMEIFRERDEGHLVLVSSMSAMRGFPGNLTTYAATKAAVSSLAEGIRADTMGTPIAVTALHPGYIRTELNAGSRGGPLMTAVEPGVRSMVRAIERERVSTCNPAWWTPIGFVIRHIPLRLLARAS